MNHPSSLDLEAFVVGEPLPASFAGHVEACAECAAFVASLRGVVESAPSRAADYAEAAVARAARRTPQPREGQAKKAIPPKMRSLWPLATTVLAPLAAAAAIVLLTRSSFPPVATPVASTEGPRPPDRILLGTLPTGTSLAASEPDTRFKGGLQVSVVRERGGTQTRFSGTVPVRPGDRLRLEVALDHDEAILGGVLADDGSYLELMPEGVRGSGTHYSERSAKIDASPMRGTIVVGAPQDVARLREQRKANAVSPASGGADLTTLRVEWEGP